jgi:RimJ/RimL family protein N-acetyltransferase
MRKADPLKCLPVRRSDYRFLYRLLKERPAYANISHRSLPTYPEHVRFVSGRPYEEWFVLWIGARRVGSLYLTRAGEIGVFVGQAFQGKGIGSGALEWMIDRHRGRRLLANINPANVRSIELFEHLGFRHIQNTYEYQAGAERSIAARGRRKEPTGRTKKSAPSQ